MPESPSTIAHRTLDLLSEAPGHYDFMQCQQPAPPLFHKACLLGWIGWMAGIPGSQGKGDSYLGRVANFLGYDLRASVYHDLSHRLRKIGFDLNNDLFRPDYQPETLPILRQWADTLPIKEK